jgi:hypothetical protein
MDEISIIPGEITGFNLIIRICNGIHDPGGQEKVTGSKKINDAPMGFGR